MVRRRPACLALVFAVAGDRLVVVTPEGGPVGTVLHRPLLRVLRARLLRLLSE